MWRNILIALALSSCVLLTACGGSTKPTPLGNGNSIPMSLTIGDTPPNGVAVLFFEASIAGASLQPSDSSKAAVPVMTTPVEVEFGHLQTDTAFLSLANVAPDTYNSITLTFSNAVLTMVNHSGAAIGTCANNSVCQLMPTLNPSSAMLSGAPFPLMLDANSVFGLKLDLNVNSSVQNDLSINPTVTVAHVTQRHDSDEGQEMENLDEVDGQVTTVGSNQFTLMNARSGQSFTINVDGNTTFQDFDRAGCTASPADFTCVKMGQILDVNLSENGTGTMLANAWSLWKTPACVATTSEPSISAGGSLKKYYRGGITALAKKCLCKRVNFSWVCAQTEKKSTRSCETRAGSSCCSQCVASGKVMSSAWVQ